MLGDEWMISVYDNSAVSDTKLYKAVIIELLILYLTESSFDVIGRVFSPRETFLFAILYAGFIQKVRERRLCC